METAHPDIDALRVRLRAGLPRVADLPELTIPPPPRPWASGGVKRGQRWDLPLRALLITLAGAAAPMLVLAAIGWWAAP